MYIKEAKSVQTFLLTIMKGFCCVIDSHTQYTHLPFRESVHCQTLCNMISDAAIHERVRHELQIFVSSVPKLRWRGVTESPLLGPAGNKEFLVLIEKNG